MNTQPTKDYVYGMLSDIDIKRYLQDGTIKIESSNIDTDGFNINQVQLGSIDLHFRRQIMRFDTSTNKPITYKDRDYANSTDVKQGKLIIQPKEVILATTQECINLPTDFAGIITGRSSIARLGIMVHCCQEFINPGHGQPIPLQLINLSPRPVELKLNVPICQLVLFKLHTPASKRYKEESSSKYSKETTPMISAIHEEVEDNHEELVDSTKGETSKTNAADFHQSEGFLYKILPHILFLIKDLLLILITVFISNSTIVKDLFEEGRTINEFISAIVDYPSSATFLLVALFILIYVGISIFNNKRGK